MKASNNLIQALKRFEGFSAKAYKCPANVWTIGYGTTDGVKPGQIITKEKAEKMLIDDLVPCETIVNNLGIKFSQNQFDALVDFVYNCGSKNFLNSMLLKKIKENKDNPKISEEFKRWVFANGVRLPGLVSRREWEAETYFKK